MFSLPQDALRQQLIAAMAGHKRRDDRVAKLIWATVAINAGVGAIPVTPPGACVFAIVVMVVLMGNEYGVLLDHNAAWKVFRQILMSAGLSFCGLHFGLEFAGSLLKYGGLASFGMTTVLGVAICGVLAATVTYAVGFTAWEYFRRDQKLSQSEMKGIFQKYFSEGRQTVRSKVNHQPASKRKG